MVAAVDYFMSDQVVFLSSVAFSRFSDNAYVGDECCRNAVDKAYPFLPFDRCKYVDEMTMEESVRCFSRIVQMIARKPFPLWSLLGQEISSP